MTLSDRLLEQFNKLNHRQQKRLLDFAQTLNESSEPQGEPGTSIIVATGYFDSQALDEMEAAIEEAYKG